MQILVVGSETHVCNATEYIIAVQKSKVISGSTKVVDFGTNRKRVFDFLLIINSNPCRISHRFGDTAAYGHSNYTYIVCIRCFLLAGDVMFMGVSIDM